MRFLLQGLGLVSLVALLVACAQTSPISPLGELRAVHSASSLIGGEWRVEDLAHKGVIDYAVSTLNFSDNGVISGSGACNRYSGQYSTGSESKLIIGKLVSTRMACVDAAMNQENLFFKLLEKVQTYRFSADDALILQTQEGQTITARRH